MYMDVSQYLIYISMVISIVTIIVVFSVMVSKKQFATSQYNNTSASVKVNTSIFSASNTNYTLKDYYIMGAYNTCVQGPFNSGIVSIQYLKNAIALGYRFLDFEIYSSTTDTPMVSCSSAVTSCGTSPQSYYLLPFSEVMSTINTYAFSNSGCMNFKDPLIISLRIKTCNVNVLSNLGTIFKKYSNRMLGPKYSFNTNNTNFGDTPLSDLMGKICVIVDSDSVHYTNSPLFMEYVNMSSVTGFMKNMTHSSFKNIASLNDLITHNQTNMTIIIPDYNNYNPSNTVVQAYQNAGCQVVCMNIWKNDSYLSVHNDFFGQYKCAFVLKPQQFRSTPQTIATPTPQGSSNSYASRSLNTGVAGITYNI